MKRHMGKCTKCVYLLIAVIVGLSLTGFSAIDKSTPIGNSGESQTDGMAKNVQGLSTSAESDKDIDVDGDDEGDESLDSMRRNSLNMLNYMTTMTQRVNENRKNQLFLDSAYDSFDNLFPNSVDTKTQTQITSLMDTIQGYRMLSVKRERLEYIYEQNRAQAFREAIPNPVGLLSAVQSGSLLKAAASVLYMAVDSVSSYQSAMSQADQQFVQAGWELDDEEANNLHESIKDEQDYLLDMVRDHEIPGDSSLNRKAVDDFVSWSQKDDSELERKIAWFESETNNKAYSDFGPYWLELAKDYYNYGNYEKCLEAVNRYEGIATRIFRKDKEYANTLPMAIISAKETMGSSDYVNTAIRYCNLIRENTADDDWTLRYFVAQIYMDLYAITNNDSYLDEAYEIARANVVVLVDEQKKLNTSYLQDVQKVDVPMWTPLDRDPKNKEKREYNEALEHERKVALPPVNEALYLNSDLLFALAEKRGIDNTEKEKIQNILHAKGKQIFLTKALDDRFWFDGPTETVNPKDLDVKYEGEVFRIPASCVTDRSSITVTVSGSGTTATFDDWAVDNVDRHDSKDCSEFTVAYTSEGAKGHKYKPGESVTVRVIPVVESPDEHFEFTYDVKASKKFAVLDDVMFERAK